MWTWWLKIPTEYFIEEIHYQFHYPSIPKLQCFTGSNYLMDEMGMGYTVGASPIIHLKWAGKIGVSRSGQPSSTTATSRVLSIAGETKHNEIVMQCNPVQSFEKQCNPMELEVQCKSMQCCHQQSEGQCAKLSYSLIQSDDKVCLECMNVKEHNVL